MKFKFPFPWVFSAQFNDHTPNENGVGNFDEIHFIINTDTGEELGLQDENEIKCAAVVLGGYGMTMVVSISGERDSRMRSVLTIFQN